MASELTLKRMLLVLLFSGFDLTWNCQSLGPILGLCAVFWFTFNPLGGLCAYMCSKWGTEALQQSFYHEFAVSGQNIDPVMINPGTILF